MHLLEGFIGEVLAFESTKCYLRKQGIVVKKDTNKSAALGAFQKKKKKRAEIESLFGFQAPNRDKTMLWWNLHYLIIKVENKK